jgi:hypothetical protein
VRAWPDEALQIVKSLAESFSIGAARNSASRAIQVLTLRLEAFGESPKWAALVTFSAFRHTSFSFLISSISRQTLLIIAQTCFLLSNPARTAKQSWAGGWIRRIADYGMWPLNRSNSKICPRAKIIQTDFLIKLGPKKPGQVNVKVRYFTVRNH